MKRLIAATLLAAATGGPALALGATLDLPSFSFPEAPEPAVTRDCATPASAPGTDQATGQETVAPACA
jgi:hypothetical protein